MCMSFSFMFVCASHACSICKGQNRDISHHQAEIPHFLGLGLQMAVSDHAAAENGTKVPWKRSS